MFMAFLLRDHPIAGHSPQFLLAAVIGAAGLGNFIGIAVGSLMKRVNPKLTVVLAMLAGAAAAIFGALAYGLFSLVRARLRGRAGAVPGQAVAGLDDPARRARPGAHQRLRAQRHHAPAGLGDRRLRRASPSRSNPRLGLTTAAVVLVAWSVFVLAGPGRRTPSPAAAATTAN